MTTHTNTPQTPEKDKSPFSFDESSFGGRSFSAPPAFSYFGVLPEFSFPSIPIRTPPSEEQRLDNEINFHDATVDFDFTNLTQLEDRIKKEQERYEKRRSQYKQRKLNLKRDKNCIQSINHNIKSLQEQLHQKQTIITQQLQKSKELRMQKLDLLRKKY
jgi:hypothetical protein